MKKALLIFLVMSLVFSNTMVSSAENKIPSKFWTLIKEEETLISAKNEKGLIEKRLEIIGLFDQWVKSDTTRLGIVAPRYEKIAKAYEAIGDYENALLYWHLYRENAELLFIAGTWNRDALNVAESKIKNLTFDIQLYAKAPDQFLSTYYGAKFEPVSGVYFGSTYDLDPKVGTYDWDKVKKEYPKENSAYLIYLDWRTPIKDFNHYYQSAVKAGNGIQLAWNVYEDIINIKEDDGYIKETAEYLRDLGVPIFLRYACEMNIADGIKNPTLYIKNFRYVADKVREIAPNVAMVWSPGDVTAQNKTLESFYPGDAYVDWIGISSYTTYYHGTQTNWGQNDDAYNSYYFTKEYANPVARIKGIVDTYGDRKPIMISETGVAHYSKIAKEDFTDWAMVQMDRLYQYIPMVYPQVKAIYYFNVDTAIATTRSSYALYTNNSIKDKYNKLIASPYFLSDIDATAPFRYAHIGSVKDKSVTLLDSDLELSTYVIVPKTLKPIVIYELDGKVISQKTAIPYTQTLSKSTVSEGVHTLKVMVKNEAGNTLKTKAYTVVKQGNQFKIEEGTYETTTFMDISNNWGKRFINEIGKRGLIVGSNQQFKPNDSITRAQLSSIISKLLGETYMPVKANLYTDVSSSKWYYDSVQKAQAFLVGYGKLFYPDRQATREELIASIINLKGYRISDLTKTEIEQLKTSIVDYSQISKDYQSQMLLAMYHGIVSGYPDGTIRAQNSISRAEATVILYNSFFK